MIKEFLTPEDIQKCATKYGNRIPFGPIGEIVDIRTYRRFKPEDSSRETLFERDARVINHNLSLVADLLSYEELRAEALLMQDKFAQMKSAPSSRAKWVGGAEASINNPVSIFNCSAFAINRLSAFSDLFSILMLGCGGGFRVFQRDISKLPTLYNKKLEITFYDYSPIPKSYREEHTASNQRGNKLFVTVGDSREGWIEALMTYLHEVTKENSTIKEIAFDLDNIRPLGERIHGFGGTASGPNALKQIIQDIDLIIKECPKPRLRSIDCMDICCAIAKGVVAGSARRSALICLFDEGDELCANAKKGLYTNPELAHKSYRSQSNNTECVGSIHYDTLIEWLKLYPNKSEKEIYQYIAQFKPTKDYLVKRFESIRLEGEPGFDNYLAMVVRRYLAAREWRPNQDPFLFTDVATNP